MLTVRDQRRGRSKSPSGRERSTSRDNRDHSRDARDSRAKSPSRKEKKKKSSKRYSESESEDEDRRHREKKSSKQYYDSDLDDGKAKSKKKSSKGYEESGSEDSDRRHRKSSSKKYDESDSDDRRKSHNEEKRTSRRHDGHESESDHPRDTRKKSSKKASRKDESGSSGDSQDSPGRRHKQGHAPDPHSARSTEQHHGYENGGHPSYAQPPPFMYSQPSAPYTQTPPYMQNAQYVPLPHPAEPPQMSSHDFVDPRHEQWRDQWAPVPETLSDSRSLSNTTAWRLSRVPTGGTGQSTDCGNYVQPSPYQYAQVDPNIKYKSKAEKTYIQNPSYSYGMPQYMQSPHPQHVELKPGTGKNERRDKRQQQYRSDEAPSHRDLASRLGHLSISTGAGVAAGAGLLAAGSTNYNDDRPPASPLLEAYHGTYQSISPMPSPMMLAKKKHDDSDLSDLSDLDQSTSKKQKQKTKSKRPDHYNEEKTIEHSYKSHRPSNASTIGSSAGGNEGSGAAELIIASTPRTPKRVSFYDPTPDAIKIASALAGTHHAPNTQPLISILPSLSTDDMLTLRAEYKNHAKASGMGINMAKHIKMRVPGNLGKAAYATALGRWESEAYWANSWYQSGGSRRELLIESLMGRSNSEIREIKNCFRDKRYHDDLEKCMRAELKADKFRTAILLALEEKRMSDSTASLDPDLIHQDVDDLYRALISRDGGETAMISIIVLRSDSHLRSVLRTFESVHHVNFAREMIAKSRNLVGETLAHILNGALNRPMRDALLLHQAIAETVSGKERAELLISRAVRLHWEPRHMSRVLRVYDERYGVSVAEALKVEVWDSMKTPEGRLWVEFVAGCLGLAGDEDWLGARVGGRADRDGNLNRDRDHGRDRDRDRDRYHGHPDEDQTARRRRTSSHTSSAAPAPPPSAGGGSIGGSGGGSRKYSLGGPRDRDRDRGSRDVAYDIEERRPRRS